ncbi:MAG: CBS domain-containing protein, partial [Hymenobacter sp.]
MCKQSRSDLIIPLMIVASISFAISKRFDKHSLDVKGLVKKGNVFTSNKDTNILWTLNIDNIIHTDYATLQPEDSIEKLRKMIKYSDQVIFPVVKEGTLLGTIYFNDVRELIFSDHNSHVGSLMSLPSEIVQQSDSMETVMYKFEQSTKAYLPVVKDGTYYGFIAKADALE